MNRDTRAVQTSGGMLLGLAVVLSAVLLGAAGVERRVTIDGSSTVAPILNATAKLFEGKSSAKTKITVGISGTGGGFKKFLDAQPELRTDIANASRPIKPEEASLAAKVGVEYIEMPVALDGMAVTVNPKNDWCDHLTLAELKNIWQPGSTIKNWKDVRAGFPDVPLRLYGPGTDSGTFDYFVEAVIGGGAKSTRPDFEASENDNTLVRGVAGERGALGYFGFSYYDANQKALKLLAIDSGDGKPVKPSVEAIRTNAYHPLSRPLFIYVNRKSADRPEIQEFVDYLLTNAKTIVEHPRVGYVSLPPELMSIVQARFRERATGTLFPTAASVHRPLAEVYGTRSTATETPKP